MNHGPFWILDKKIIPRGILRLSFKFRVSQPLCGWVVGFVGVFFFHITPLGSGFQLLLFIPFFFNDLEIFE